MNDPLNLKICSIVMHYSPETVDDAAQLLFSVIGQTEVKPGCRRCWVGRSVGEESRIDYQELWDSEKAFLRHIRSEEFQRVLTAMDLATKSPGS